MGIPREVGSRTKLSEIRWSNLHGKFVGGKAKMVWTCNEKIHRCPNEIGVRN